jgi:hypothetical protein
MKRKTNQPAAPAAAMIYEQTAPAPTITEPNEAQEKSFSTNGKVE